jgi:hypothetical protein
MSSRRTGAHGAKKKRNKPYRPMTGRVVGGVATLGYHAQRNAKVEDLLNSHYGDEQRDEIAGAYWMCFQQLKMGAATGEAWATVTVTLNKALLMCETGFGEEYTTQMQLALDAIYRAQLRGEQTGAYRLDGEGIGAVSEALTIHDEQMKLVTFRDVRRVDEMLQMRLDSGNVYRAEMMY